MKVPSHGHYFDAIIIMLVMMMVIAVVVMVRVVMVMVLVMMMVKLILFVLFPCSMGGRLGLLRLLLQLLLRLWP